MHRLLFNKVAGAARIPFYRTLPYHNLSDMKIFYIEFLPTYTLCHISFCHGGESIETIEKVLSKFSRIF